jgi:hypothetical protein
MVGTARSNHMRDITSSRASGNHRRRPSATTLTDDPRVIKFFADAFDADRLVLGTDAPRVRAGEWANRVKAVPGLDDRQLQGVLNDTAASLGIGE